MEPSVHDGDKLNTFLIDSRCQQLLSTVILILGGWFE